MYVFLNYEDDPTEAYIDARDKMTGEEKAEVREEIRKLDKAFPEHFASRYKGDPKFSGCPYHETLKKYIPTQEKVVSDELHEIEKQSGVIE